MQHNTTPDTLFLSVLKLADRQSAAIAGSRTRQSQSRDDSCAGIPTITHTLLPVFLAGNVVARRVENTSKTTVHNVFAMLKFEI